MNRMMFRLLFSAAGLSLAIFGCSDHLPVIHTGPIERTVIGGVDDNFAQGNVESPCFVDDMVAFVEAGWQLDVEQGQFDQPTADLHFGTLLKLPEAREEEWEEIESARLTLRLRCLDGESSNDSFSLIGRDENGEPYDLWSTWIWFLNNNTWKAGDEVIVEFDLTNMPSGSHAGRYPTNVLSGLRDGELFIVVEDDTAVDFIKLEASTNPDNT